MTENVDVYWSFRSPYSYLVTPDLKRLREDCDVNIHFRIVYPIAIRDPDMLFTEANIHRARYIGMDAFRRAQFLGLPYRRGNPDPVVQDFETGKVSDEQPYIYQLSALGVEAERLGKGLDFASEVSAIIFGGIDGWDQGSHLEEAAVRAGLDLNEMKAAIEIGDHFEEIERNQEALARVHWGVPTMVLRNEPFFGQDRIDTLRWRLEQYQLEAS